MPGISSVATDAGSAHAANVKVDATFVNKVVASPKKDSDMSSNSSSGGGSSTPLITGIAGGIGGA
eukprot:2370821-Rhodomonas_salina.1